MLTISPTRRHPSTATAAAADFVCFGALDAPVPAVELVTSAMPEGIAFTAHAAATLRAYLQKHGLGHYNIFFTTLADLYDVDEHLNSLGDGVAWEAAPCAVPGGEGVNLLRSGRMGSTLKTSGFLLLPNQEVVIARWLWVDPILNNPREIWLYAAEGPEPFLKLRKELLRLRHAGDRPTWQIATGGYSERERVPRDVVGEDDLLLSAALRERTEAEAVRFFSDEAASLYRAMNVPYRRGMLLFGPPGNGKTSLIRRIGSRLKQVSCTILRPAAGFDADDLTSVVKQWISEAPALLVIEDLNWLLKAVDLSTFLNLLDGIDTARSTGGLMIIATTNHPDQLDPAVNNRPGRFDVVVEVPPPDRDLRRRYFQTKLTEMDDEAVNLLADRTDDLSFAHLQEILRTAGLLAINAGRSTRTVDDLLVATKLVRDAHEDASRGFPRLEMPFGLSPRKDR